ncbi:MAG: hypothetical protein ACLP8S_32700 [Solirubrobacteraceae bacterium]
MGADGALQIVDVADVGEKALLTHDPGRDDPGLAFSLAKLSDDPTGPTPIGIFRDVSRHVYGRSVAQSEAASVDELEKLLHEGETWTVD